MGLNVGGGGEGGVNLHSTLMSSLVTFLTRSINLSKGQNWVQPGKDKTSGLRPSSETFLYKIYKRREKSSIRFIHSNVNSSTNLNGQVVGLELVQFDQDHRSVRWLDVVEYLQGREKSGYGDVVSWIHEQLPVGRGQLRLGVISQMFNQLLHQRTCHTSFYGFQTSRKLFIYLYLREDAAFPGCKPSWKN